jgi:polysaccharide export outer membrane protein
VRRQLAAIVSLVLAVGIARPQALTQHNPEYRLEYSDSLTIVFRYTPEFNQEVTIGPDGRAVIAGLGTIVARGLTLDQFHNQVVSVASIHLVNPEVSLTLKNFVKPHVFVEGEVNTPGRVDLRGDISALDAIALAGGFRDSGAKANVLLLRQGDGQVSQTRVIDLTYFIKNHKLEEIPQMRAGDVLYVSSTKFSKLQAIAHLGALGAIYNPIH